MMKNRLIKTRDWSEQLADAAFDFRLQLMLVAIGKLGAEPALEKGLESFDQVYDLWKAEMDGGVSSALEIASPSLFDGVDSIARNYIDEIVIAIRSSIVGFFPDELLSSMDATLGVHARVSFLWSTAKKNGVASPKLIEKELKVACGKAGNKEKRKRLRVEFNAAIRREAHPEVIEKTATKTATKKTASEVMLEKVRETPEAAGWSLSEWVRETKIKKTTISSCKAYRSPLMRKGRELRRAIGIEEFQKDASLLDGERRRQD